MAEKKNIQKKYSLTQEEKEKIQNYQSIMAILRIQREGLASLIREEITGIRNRIGLTYQAPEGYERVIDFDPDTYEITVSDLFVEKKEEPLKN